MISRIALFIALVLTQACRVSAHEEPTSFLELHVGNDGLRAIFTASATDLAHDLPDVEAGMLLTQSVADAQGGPEHWLAVVLVGAKGAHWGVPELSGAGLFG